MHLSPLHLLVVAIVVLVLFGRGKVSNLMGEFGRGITAFKKGVSDGTYRAGKRSGGQGCARCDPGGRASTTDKDKV